MDAKDLRTETALSERNNYGSKYSQSGGALQCNRSKSYQDIGTNPLAKTDPPTVRPCAVIGPDRVLPPPNSTDAYLKKGPTEPWTCPDSMYPRPPDYPHPHKIANNTNPSRNISPRQTFQENMQRIMVPPSYNVIKSSDDPNFSHGQERSAVMSKNTKPNLPSEAKYCDVPYPVNPYTNEHKNIRESEISAVNSPLTRPVPHGWPPSGVNLHTPRSYGAHELYQYQQYPSCAGPRPPVIPVARTHRILQEDPGFMSPEAYYQDGNMHLKPHAYPHLKERYPQPRYEYIGNYSHPFHAASSFRHHKYDLTKPGPPHHYPIYPHLKNVDNRIPENPMESFPRSLNQQPNYNMPFRNQIIHPTYSGLPALGNAPSKVIPYPTDASGKPIITNKLPYDNNNKIYVDFDNTRVKTFPMNDPYFINEMTRAHPVKNQVMPPNYPGPGMHPVQTQQYYRKDIPHMKTHEYMPHYRNFDPSLGGFPMLRHAPQFSPNTLAISPSDSNTSNDTTQTQGTNQDDCGYVSQSSTASVRSLDSAINRISNDYYRRHDYRYGPNIGNNPMFIKSDTNHTNSSSSKDKKQINVRQFLQMWNEGDDDNGENSNTKEIIIKTSNNDINTKQEQLYVLGLVNVPSEELGKYDHIQKVSKLPENIKGYNNIELLNQFEEAIESSNICFKSPMQKEFISLKENKNASSKHVVGVLPRPLSPLDVEAKISQSVIHKEVGCNFEIKPCSPKMMNVEVAAPAQNILGERVIEKVSNPLSSIVKSPMPVRIDDSIACNKSPLSKIVKSPMPVRVDENVPCNKIKRRDSLTTYENPSCKMIKSPFSVQNTDSMKSNYSLQDLETNSSVCLASLPRLDNEIELNFPEVNQQFIDANKIENVSLSKYPKEIDRQVHNLDSNNTSNNLIVNLPNNENYPSVSADVDGFEKKCTKLSKYRKLKGNSIENLDSSPKSNFRTDSVIIKNPDTVKKTRNEMDTKNKMLEDRDHVPMNLSTENVFHHNHGSIMELNDSKYEDKHTDDTDIAIDFSLNKVDPLIPPFHIDNPVEQSIMSVDTCIDSDIKEVVEMDLEKTIETSATTLDNGNDKYLNYDIKADGDINIDEMINSVVEKVVSETCNKSNISNEVPVGDIPKICVNSKNNYDLNYDPPQKNNFDEDTSTNIESSATISYEDPTPRNNSVIAANTTSELTGNEMITELSDNHKVIDMDLLEEECKNEVDDPICKKLYPQDCSETDHKEIKEEYNDNVENEENVNESTSRETFIEKSLVNEAEEIVNKNELIMEVTEPEIITKSEDVKDNNLPQRRSDYIKSKNVYFSKELYSPWIQKLILHNELNHPCKNHMTDLKPLREIDNFSEKELSVKESTSCTILNENCKSPMPTVINVNSEEKSVNNKKDSYDSESINISKSDRLTSQDTKYVINESTKNNSDVSCSHQADESCDPEEKDMLLKSNTLTDDDNKISNTDDVQNSTASNNFDSIEYETENKNDNTKCTVESISESIDSPVLNNTDNSNPDVEFEEIKEIPNFPNTDIAKVSSDNDDEIKTNIINDDLREEPQSEVPIVSADDTNIIEDISVTCDLNRNEGNNSEADLNSNPDIQHDVESSNEEILDINVLDDCDIASKCIEDKTIESVLEKTDIQINDEKSGATCEEELPKCRRPSLKRSYSDSALNLFKDKENLQNVASLWPPKRTKHNETDSFDHDIVAENISNYIQNNRRNSISSIHNEENISICILIENDCIITEESEPEKICITEFSEDYVAEINTTDQYDTENIILHTAPSIEESDCDISDSVTLECQEEKIIHEDPWVDDIGCVETVVSDDIAEDVVISASSTPKYDDSSEFEESGIFCNSLNEHTEKVKSIYGENMSDDDAQIVDTLFRTPQMNVNRTLTSHSTHDPEFNKDAFFEDDNDLESILSEPNKQQLSLCALEYNDSNYKNFELAESPFDKENILKNEIIPYVNSKDYADNIENDENKLYTNDAVDPVYKITQDDTVHSCESSIDSDFHDKLKEEEHSSYISSSPEVSSTTSEEKNTGILLKITNYNGSRVSQINEIKSNGKPRCKFTENKDYSNSNPKFSNRPLITKAAQKYIPPLKESIRDLKVQISLPQQSLMKFKQLKLSRNEPKVRNKHNSVPVSPKKPKPNFGDVLKSIDEIQIKMHKEKNKKGKNAVPKVVIKKNQNGSHYASTPNKETYNPDLTGRKWQPWVFIEKNEFIDKMAVKKKSRAIFNHRNNTYVLAEKFRKYKSVSSTKFVISQPKSSDPSAGHLKYTIRLKHSY